MSELGITAWPSQPLPCGDVDLPTLEVVNGANGVWFYLRPTARTVDLPADFYLREPREVDLGDLGAVAAFVGAWGRFSDDEYRDIPGGRTWSSPVERNARARGWLPRRGDLGQHRHALGEALGLEPLQAILELVHPAEVVLRLEKLAAMADHIERWQRGGDPDVPWPGGEAPGWVLLRDYLNAALSAFQVRIEVMGQRPSVAGQPVTAYSVAALQLWNDLHGATWRGCDMCGRLFTKQRGRGRHYSHSEGVRFCTRRCANLHTQREYRRRHRAKREQER